MLLSLCHLDGSIHKSDKAKLVDPLLQRLMNEQSLPSSLDAVVIDFFYLQTLKDVLESFGAISQNILRHLSRCPAKQIHIIFNTFAEPSKRDNARKIQANLRDSDFIIEGPDTKPA